MAWTAEHAESEIVVREKVKVTKFHQSFHFKVFNLQSAFEFLSISGPPLVEDICKLDPTALGWIIEDRELCNRVKIEAMYERVVKEQEKEVIQIKQEETMEIPKNMDYLSKSLSLSFEEREKLIMIQPQTIAAGKNFSFICWYFLHFFSLNSDKNPRDHPVNHRSAVEIC